MSTREEQLRRLQVLNDSIQQVDPQLSEEVMEAFPGRNEETARPVEDDINEESIVLRKTRPVLAIKNGTAELVFAQSEDSTIWKDRLTKAKGLIETANRSVGRVNLAGHPDFEWVGTGWLVDTDILVTNRHVARTFSQRDGERLVFQTGTSGAVKASCDFLQEVANPAQLVFQLAEVLHVEEPPGPDLAFLRVEPVSGTQLAAPIPLSARPPEQTKIAATIGYPAYDSRIPEIDLMEEIYGKVYNKKRLAPGSITRVEPQRILHDCTTLGGNSGSVVLDLDRGEAVGLHFSGRFMSTNYAVRADVVAQCLENCKHPARRTPVEAVAPRSTATNGRQLPPPQPVARPATPAATTHHVVTARGGGASVSIPLVVTVSLGDAFQPVMQPPAPRPRPAAATNGKASDGEVATEAVAKDYSDREGYQRDFLGDDAIVGLPQIARDLDDVLAFGDHETELKYEHFSVVMSASRRLCRFSACNIAGAESKKTTRAGWRTDPRISKSAQILNECYGSPPKFSRGHMTRREDPAWGPAATARRGNEDSMHVTNTTPQMQAFNSPIWLALEDYALQHARQDKMRITVITGPYLEDDDPVLFKVRCPVMFWKIVAFIHDKTKQLCATGYEMSQAQNLADDEFVFGAFTSPQLNVTTQVPIRSIELRSGIDFGGLVAVDPLSSEETPGDGQGVRLERFEEIRFV